MTLATPTRSSRRDPRAVRSGIPARNRAAAVLLGLVPFAQLTALGANDQMLAAIAACVDLLAALAVLALLLPTGGFWRNAAPVIVLLAAALAWAVLPDLGGAPTTRIAPDLLRAGVFRYVGTSAMLLAGAMIGYRRGLLRTSVDWVLGFGIANVVLALVMRQFDPAHVWGLDKNIHVGRFTGTLQNANAAGSVFGLIAVIALARMIVARREVLLMGGDRRRIALAASAVALMVSFGACLVTASRAAVALTVVALVAVLLGAWVAHAARRASRARQAALVACGTAAFAALGALGWWLGLSADFGSGRFAALGEDSIDRLVIWRHYAALARAAPWYGYGLGSFSSLNLHMLGNAREAVAFGYINAAHNQALQLVLAGGWPFLALHVASGIAMLWPVARMPRPDPHDPLPGAVLLGLVVVLGCSMVDIALTVPAIGALAAALFGLLWGRGLRAAADRAAVRKAAA